MCSAERYSILSASISKILTKKYGIHKKFLNPSNINKLDSNDINTSSNKIQNYFESEISIGCFRSVTEWLAAASELAKASKAASMGSIWDTNLGKDLAKALISRRLSLSFIDFYEIIKFFAFLKDDKLQIVPKLLDLEHLEHIISEGEDDYSKILNLPLLLHISGSNIPKTSLSNFTKIVSKYIKNSNKIESEKLNLFVSAQIGLVNLGFADPDAMTVLNKKIEENSSIDPHSIQLLNTSLLANSSSFNNRIEEYCKIIKMVDKNLDILPLSHLTTHVLIRAMLNNVFKIDNTCLFNTIISKYPKMLLEDKIISVWSLISMNMNPLDNLMNDIFSPENINSIPKYLRSMVDQIYITAKLHGYMPSYNIGLLTTINQSAPNRLSNRILRYLKSAGISAKITKNIPELPYYKFDVIIIAKGENPKLDFKGIIVTTYSNFYTVKNPLLWDPFYIIRGSHIRTVGYREVQIQANIHSDTTNTSV